MAKKSVEARNKKRKILSDRFRNDRANLRKLIKGDDDELREEALIKLHKRSRNESACRVRNRCESCGRAHGVYKRFNLCRMCLRKNQVLGYVPGLKKSSW